MRRCEDDPAVPAFLPPRTGFLPQAGAKKRSPGCFGCEAGPASRLAARDPHSSAVFVACSRAPSDVVVLVAGRAHMRLELFKLGPFRKCVCLHWPLSIIAVPLPRTTAGSRAAGTRGDKRQEQEGHMRTKRPAAMGCSQASQEEASQQPAASARARARCSAR